MIYLNGASRRAFAATDARESARSAVRTMLDHPECRALTMAHTLCDTGAQARFPEERIFRSIADAAGFSTRIEVRSLRQGYEHRLLLVRDPSMPLGEVDLLMADSYFVC